MAVFRKLLPAEAGRYRDHLLRLSQADRRARFFGSMSDDAIRNYVDRISWSRTIVLAAIQRGEVRAAAELRLGDRPGEAAELAFSVEQELQGQGVGTILTRRILTAARNRCVRRVYMICQSDNRRMQRIASKLIGLCRFEDGDVISTKDLPPATALSVAQEFIDTGAVPMATMLDQWQRPESAAA
ncbi:GNAT family N-acetyltransferase [Indioceanicola profundi]|uniref:GNAT family N-acetyltransferase n=1 Tax=Indioceanicola profundi TaxID=2220096 RepID=UPI000E6A9906|nr:GNAT family N-acetyltransferase [Indioceanicola profundi]